MSSIFELFGLPPSSPAKMPAARSTKESSRTFSLACDRRSAPSLGAPPGLIPTQSTVLRRRVQLGEPPAVVGGIPGGAGGGPLRAAGVATLVAPPRQPRRPRHPQLPRRWARSASSAISSCRSSSSLSAKRCSDPERASRVRQAYLGVDATPAPIAAAARRPRRWLRLPKPTRARAVRARIRRGPALGGQTRPRSASSPSSAPRSAATKQVTQQQIINHAATTATQRFSEKYGTVLSPAELQFVCESAGYQKLPDAIYPTTVNPATGQGDWNQAMERALEFALRSNDAIFAKVIGGVAGAGPPDSRHADTRSGYAHACKLTGRYLLPHPHLVKVQHGHRSRQWPDGTGKMSEKSRLQLVAELVNGDGEPARLTRRRDLVDGHTDPE